MLLMWSYGNIQLLSSFKGERIKVSVTVVRDMVLGLKGFLADVER